AVPVDERDRQASDVGFADGAALDGPREHPVALAVRRAPAANVPDHAARADRLAVARLEVRAADAIVHAKAAFSTKTYPPKTAIHTKLIIPTASSATISPPQQPAHQRPFSTPIRNAPKCPSRQPCNTRASGSRQVRRQRRFSGVSW